jgi:hypothetical protein
MRYLFTIEVGPFFAVELLVEHLDVLGVYEIHECVAHITSILGCCDRKYLEIDWQVEEVVGLLVALVY